MWWFSGMPYEVRMIERVVGGVEFVVVVGWYCRTVKN